MLIFFKNSEKQLVKNLLYKNWNRESTKENTTGMEWTHHQGISVVAIL